MNCNHIIHEFIYKLRTGICCSNEIPSDMFTAYSTYCESLNVMTTFANFLFHRFLSRAELEIKNLQVVLSRDIDGSHH